MVNFHTFVVVFLQIACFLSKLQRTSSQRPLRVSTNTFFWMWHPCSQRRFFHSKSWPAGMAMLQSLHLGWCISVTDLDVAHLSHLRSLTSLTLAYTKVADSTSVERRGSHHDMTCLCPKERRAALLSAPCIHRHSTDRRPCPGHSQVTDAGVEWLKGLRGLQSLDLQVGM